ILTAGNELQAAWEELKSFDADAFKKNDYTDEDVKYRLLFRMQYQGQLNDLEIEAPIEAFKNINDYDTFVKNIEKMYTRVYSKSVLSRELGYSITGAIVRGIVDVTLPKIPKETLSEETPPKVAFLGARSIYWDGEWLEADIYEMEKLLPGNKLGA